MKKGNLMKLILVRHGESVDDTINCYGGAADFSLNESGREAAKELAQTFVYLKVDKIYSSPMKRAKETAQEIEAVKTCGILTIDGLRERNSYGVISGIKKDDAKELFGWHLSTIKGKLGDYYSDELILGAEPHKEFDERITKAVKRVIEDAVASGYETVIAVTHGNVTRSIYQNILNYGKRIDLDHLAKSVIDYQDGVFTLESIEGITNK